MLSIIENFSTEKLPQHFLGVTWFNAGFSRQSQEKPFTLHRQQRPRDDVERWSPFSSLKCPQLSFFQILLPNRTQSLENSIMICPEPSASDFFSSLTRNEKKVAHHQVLTCVYVHLTQQPNTWLALAKSSRYVATHNERGWFFGNLEVSIVILSTYMPFLLCIIF